MSKNIRSLIIAVIIFAAFYVIISANPGLYPAWLFSNQVKVLIFLVLLGLIRGVPDLMRLISHWWVSRKKVINGGKVISRIGFDSDVRSAFSTRMKQAGDNLSDAAVALHRRGYEEEALESRNLAGEIRSTGVRLGSGSGGSGLTVSSPRITNDRAGRIVEFDKKLLALAEEIENNSMDIVNSARNESPGDTSADIRHIDETLRIFRQLFEEREEMLNGIR
jgi:hypothetical protein